MQADLISQSHEDAARVNHSWRTQIVLLKLFDTFSYAGLALWVGVLVVAVFVFTCVQMGGGVFRRACIVLLAATTPAVIWSARQYMASLLFMSTPGHIPYLLERRAGNRLCVLPPLFALWVNLHTGYTLRSLMTAVSLWGRW